MKVKQIITFASRKQTYVLVQCFLLLFSSTVDASFELKGSSARVQGLGLAYVGLANTPEAIFINSSGLAQLKGFASSIYYTRPFGIKELNYGSIVATMSTPLANVALGCLNFGNELYNELSFILAFARHYRNNFFYGINLHYMKLQIAGYGSDFSFAFDGGFLAKLNDHLGWGFFATNITRTRIGNSKDQLPQTICSGFSYAPCHDLVLNIDIFKDVNFPIELRLGIEYRLLNRLALRTGIVSEPTQFACGIGFFFSRFTVDYAMTTHQILGLSHHVSLQLQTKSKPLSAPTLEPLKPTSQSEIAIKININTADEKAWQQLPGIGPKLARRIIEYRLQVGRFNSIEELSHVKGISKSKLEKLKPYLTMD